MKPKRIRVYNPDALAKLPNSHGVDFYRRPYGESLYTIDLGMVADYVENRRREVETLKSQIAELEKSNECLAGRAEADQDRRRTMEIELVKLLRRLGLIHDQLVVAD